MRASGSDSRPYLLKPNARLAYKGMAKPIQERIVWRINAQGIRSDAPVPARSDKFRILTFGDSETFGWAVPLAFTFQRRMERIDGSVEVINLGIPGYNVENIADYMVEALSRYGADLVIYVFHKNDMDPPLTFSPLFGQSRLYIFLKYLNVQLNYARRKRYRSSPDGLGFFADQVDRMIEICRDRDIPLFIGFLHWPYVKGLAPSQRIDLYRELKKNSAIAPYEPGFRAGSIDIENGWKSYPKIEGHMSRAGHRETAEKFCKVISAGAENSCVPPYWRAMGDK